MDLGRDEGFGGALWSPEMASIKSAGGSSYITQATPTLAAAAAASALRTQRRAQTGRAQGGEGRKPRKKGKDSQYPAQKAHSASWTIH